jgi:hypothetical protein
MRRRGCFAQERFTDNAAGKARMLLPGLDHRSNTVGW